MLMQTDLSPASAASRATGPWSCRGPSYTGQRACPAGAQLVPRAQSRASFCLWNLTWEHPGIPTKWQVLDPRPQGPKGELAHAPTLHGATSSIS